MPGRCGPQPLLLSYWPTPGQAEDSYVLYGLVVTNGCRIRAHRFFYSRVIECANGTTVVVQCDSFSTRIEVVETDDRVTSIEVCDAPTCCSSQSSTQTIVFLAAQRFPNNNSLPFSV